MHTKKPVSETCSSCAAELHHATALAHVLCSSGFLVAVVALAFSTLERTEVWPNRSRLLATFRAPSFLVHKVCIHVGLCCCHCGTACQSNMRHLHCTWSVLSHWMSIVTMFKPSEPCQVNSHNAHPQGLLTILLKLQRIIASRGSGLPSSLVSWHTSRFYRQKACLEYTGEGWKQAARRRADTALCRSPNLRLFCHHP